MMHEGPKFPPVPMPNDPDTLYIELADYRKKSRAKPIIQQMEDEDLTEYIIEAMTLMDSYLGTAWNRDEEDQEFIFPRDIDTDQLEAPYIPRGISLACRIIVDNLVRKDMGGVAAHEVQSESNAGHSYSKFDGAQPERGFGDIPPRAMGLLAPFAENGMFFAISR